MDDIDRYISHWIHSTGLPLEELFRLLLAAVAGGMVGLEREVRGRQAGFRTNLLVCVGSALVMLVSTALARAPWPMGGIGFQINVDPGRIAYGVMTGIGFLGAGTILKAGASIRGLTTAAALWCVAAVGLAAGFGMYSLCIVSSLLVVVALWVLDYLEGVLPRVRYRMVTVRVPWHSGCISKIVEYFKAAGLEVVDVGFHRSDDLASVDVNMHIAFLNQKQYFSLERQLQERNDYQLLAVTREP